MAIASNFDLSWVRADQDLKTYQITAEPCGLAGGEPKTVDLTVTQYKSFTQYLTTFREHLNATTDDEETVRLYAEALNEFAEMHLIPSTYYLNFQRSTPTHLNQRRRATDGIDFNICALVTGNL